MLDAVEVALEAEAEGVGLLGPEACTGAGRPCRARGERRVERGLTLLPPAQASADVGVRASVRPTDRGVGDGGVGRRGCLRRRQLRRG